MHVQDYDKCLQLIQQSIQDPTSGSAYYPMFIKAMIFRQQGLIQQSLATLEDAIRLDPHNPQNLKQVGHSLYLMGKHKMALSVYDEALNKGQSDWEVHHDKGLCYMYLKQLPQCVLACFAQNKQMRKCMMCLTEQATCGTALHLTVWVLHPSCVSSHTTQLFQRNSCVAPLFTQQ
jgi:tetratricopeptide (TPR) repeat protein